jgi:hypothetical protein
MPSRRRNALKKARKARKARDAKKKTAKVLHDKRNAQAHFEAQKRKTEYELLEKANNIVYFDNIIKQKIEETIEKDIEDFLQLECILSEMLIEIELLKSYIPDLLYKQRLISLNQIIIAIKCKIDEEYDLSARAIYTKIVHGGLKVTVVSDSLGVCVYIIVPSTHKKFKTCTEHFYDYTYNVVLDDGSRKIGWDFGDPNAMLMYKIYKIMGIVPLYWPSYRSLRIHLSSNEICDKISSLEIITLKKVNKLIVEQISSLLAFNSHLF